MFSKIARILREVKRSVIRSKKSHKDVVLLKLSVHRLEGQLKDLMGMQTSLIRSEKDIRSLYKANKERIKDDIKLGRELDNAYLMMAETALGATIEIDEKSVSWRFVFSSDAVIRKRYWEDLYSGKYIYIASRLKLISAQYFARIGDERASLYAGIYLKNISTDMHDKYFSSAFNSNMEGVVNDYKDFDNYIKNKQVELLGPLSKGGRMNENSVKVAFNVVTSGEGMDVSYYASTAFAQRSDDIFKLMADNELKYIVVHAFRPDKYKFKIPAEFIHRIKPLCTFKSGFDSVLHGAQRCVYDLLHYNPKTINISGINFWTKLPYHKSSYINKNKLRDQKNMLRSWSIHDVAFSFAFMQYVCKSFDVEITDDSKNLLSLSIEEYINVLTENLEK